MEPPLTPTGWEVVKRRPRLLAATVLATIVFCVVVLIDPWSPGPVPPEARAAVQTACAEMQHAITEARAHDSEASQARIRSAVRHLERAAALDSRYDYLLRAARTMHTFDSSTPAGRREAVEAAMALGERCRFE